MKIAVSSGHRQTTILAFVDEVPAFGELPFYFRQHPESLNLHCVPEDELKARLRAILEQFRQSLPAASQGESATNDDRLVLSLPGISSFGDLELGDSCVRAGWWRSPNNFLVVDDTYAGLVAGAHSTRGICAFAGTGASVYLGDPSRAHQEFLPDKSVKLDGFGPMIGDHGSGFRLAMSTLELMGRDLDALGWEEHKSPLYEKLLKGLGADWKAIKNRGLQNGFDDLMSNRDPEWRFKIAELATVITTAAAAKDTYAEQRVIEAAKAMGTTIKTGIHLFDDMDDVPIYCQGGMFRHSSIYRKTVRDYLGKKPNECVMAQYKPIVGALLLASCIDWNLSQGEAAQDKVLEAIDGIPTDHPSREILFNVITDSE